MRLAPDLDRLAGQDLTGLRRRWRASFGRAAPVTLPKWLLVRVLTYRVQANAMGDLDRTTARQLERAEEGSGSVPLRDLRLARPGTLLVREWGGALQRVMVLERGFAWNGRSYDSLSAVAKAMTGTNWNGPRFFGLRAKRAVLGSKDGRITG